MFKAVHGLVSCSWSLTVVWMFAFQVQKYHNYLWNGDHDCQRLSDFTFFLPVGTLRGVQGDHAEESCLLKTIRSKEIKNGIICQQRFSLKHKKIQHTCTEISEELRKFKNIFGAIFI